MSAIIFNNENIIPSKIVCIGRNYVAHIEELGNEVPDDMVVFIKPNSAISQELHSFHQEPLHFEGELCFLYQKGTFTAVGFGLDLTKRNLQDKLKAKGLPWERAKAFNGSAVFSHFVGIDDLDSPLSFELTINDEVVQAGAIALMIYKPRTILSELDDFLALQDGDIVMTGTPRGVGEIPQYGKFTARVIQGSHELIAASWQAL
ncbi:MAG: 2-keto-4-pentenoate hydratase/2-oxohepta-3-ene-1,7-dioic acid hydratase in catechol pathway [Alteromonadaceae bacterium]|jgi:2-keto-4-pentenoate hydratase/2-oxohepta-3-ene-1,7-dioic acid hydratase in catechol pathway